ncbi:Stp1/IreP family PP2C-type Ser/Thr phosphatase [Alicyclobacillus sp.]|uniref:Stp1/IreP family PP2C-type Ser/Thr phosphatase n=1 Tax=Alicyclobacillus sp. TaxID=61169 RepID=UPI0025C13C1A|nr:Stp1/IreP family PP2C-type Ser/Thr phosphatase [Alicyclobacillus sp.]MCL6516421.1 Stp1/IreP family PP2C-type Ser/Thr phosphatase [Alicyclobacillus sp.]
MLLAARTHVGLVRPNNQDTYVVRTDVPPVCLVVIADGMGGAQAGEVASKLAAETVSEFVAEACRSAGAAVEPEQVLRDAVQAANHRVWEASRNSAEYVGMGTTLVAALVHDGRVCLAHVGDSRAYVLHDGELAQVTDDHSLVAELVRRGQLTEEEALHHPQRHIVTRSLGTAELADPDVSVRPLADGDVLLLCTDGLSNLVQPAELRASLLRLRGARVQADVERAADELIGLALARGGSDNITVALLVHREERETA